MSNENNTEKYFQSRLLIEDHHFWFIARADRIHTILKMNLRPGDVYLEIGCGSGGILKSTSAQFITSSVIGSELNYNVLKMNNNKENVPLIQLDACMMSFNESIDFIGIYDVLEHIQNDFTVLQEIYKILKPGGKVLITVPQHQWLWSQFDLVAGHHRRYNGSELCKQIQNAGLIVEQCEGFNYTLIVPLLISRFIRQIRKPNDSFDYFQDELHISMLTNKIGNFLMFVERVLSKLNFKTQVGSSLLIMARK